MKKIFTLIILLSTALMAENHALIIGCCSDYREEAISHLRGTTNDALHMKELLLDRGMKKSNIDYLVEKDATHKKITQAVKKMESSNLGKRDTLYLYYSGHGTGVGDSGAFAKKLVTNKDILSRLNNSAGLIPYDFNLNNPSDTLLIASRDLKPTFQKLDNKGINIVWIVDACYAGNAYRSTGKSDQKYINLQKKSTWSQSDDLPLYKHLLFYGASLTNITAQEILNDREYRGAFSVEVERCLKKPYPQKNITNKAFKLCLEKNYALYTFDASTYPLDTSMDGHIVMPATKKSADTPKHIDHKEKLFTLDNDKPALKVNIYSTARPDLALKTFCKGERLSIDLKKASNKVVVLSQDENDKVIMLSPISNQSHNTRKTLVQTDVSSPYGKDKVKVFTLEDETLYASLLAYANRPKGVLSTADAENLYHIIKKDPNFQATLIEIETISTPVSQCMQGDQ